MNKEAQIQALAEEMLEKSIVDIKKNIKKAINSGALDIDSWDGNNRTLPKIVLVAALEEEAGVWESSVPMVQKAVAKEVRNVKLFL